MSARDTTPHLQIVDVHLDGKVHGLFEGEVSCGPGLECDLVGEVLGLGRGEAPKDNHDRQG